MKEVRQLREHMGLTQQAFAVELGLSLRGIANYEEDRRPEVKILLRLMRTAERVKQPHLAQAFLTAFMHDVNLTYSDMARLANGIVKPVIISPDGDIPLQPFAGFYR